MRQSNLFPSKSRTVSNDTSTGRREIYYHGFLIVFYHLASLLIMLHMVLVRSTIGHLDFYHLPNLVGHSLPAHLWCSFSVANFYRRSYFWNSLLDGNNLMGARKGLLLQKDVLRVAESFLKVSLFLNMPTVALRPHGIVFNFKTPIKRRGIHQPLLLTNT